MAWSFSHSLNGNTSKTSGTTLVIDLNAGVSVAVGQIIIVSASGDNIQTTDGDSTNISITDSKGNTYQRAREFTNGGNAGTGVIVGTFFSIVTTALDDTDTITATFSSAITAKTMMADVFNVAAGSSVEVAGSDAVVDDGVDPSALTISGLTSQEYLWMHALGIEGPPDDGHTFDADYTRINGFSTSGGGDASNNRILGEWRIFSGTTDTVDITSLSADRDYSQTFVAFKEILASTSNASGGWIGKGGWF